MDVITFGETMLLMTPNRPGPLDTVSEFHKGLAGAESNVAIGLARLGHHSVWVSKLGNDRFGRYIHKTLRGEGVDVSHVQFDEMRPTGLFFKERLANGRTNVYYYRKNSAASDIHFDDIPTSLLAEAKYLVVTGITPALSDVNRDTVLRVTEEARTRGVKVVFDPNIRQKLWPLNEAKTTLLEIAALSHIVLPGMDEGQILTGHSSPEDIAQTLIDAGTELVVVKLGPQGAYYQTPADSGYVEEFQVDLVDEVGAGDAFAAGLLSGLLDGEDVPSAVRRAAALGALAVTGYGDYECLPYRNELELFMRGRSQPSR